MQTFLSLSPWGNSIAMLHPFIVLYIFMAYFQIHYWLILQLNDLDYIKVWEDMILIERNFNKFCV